MGLLETDRLVLRYFEVDDLDAMHALFGDPEVVRWMGDGQVLTRDRCAEWIRVCRRNYATRGYGASAVVEKATGALVGLCGVVHPQGRDAAEILYAFAPGRWGRGYASELVPAVLEAALGPWGLPRVLATVAPENLASARIAEKAGMVRRPDELDDDGLPMRVYAAERAASP